MSMRHAVYAIINSNILDLTPANLKIEASIFHGKVNISEEINLCMYIH